jgi:hypothetical protein
MVPGFLERTRRLHHSSQSRHRSGPWWPNALLAVGAGGHGSSQKTTKANRKHEEDEEHERDESYPEHSFILEIGAAGEWPLNGERPNFGGTIAGEVEPIENWLEPEFGFSTLATAGRTELSGDLLFKQTFLPPPNSWLAWDHPFHGPSMASNRAIHGASNSRSIGCSGPPIISVGLLSRPGA